ncbi:Transcription initiation factor TFIID subunit 2 [Recurvomyces mirabilis]|uniref:Transcription initiation factor TFIID subunit 2 n=1 Tax=Recurvomyces mirabilis TaxID=574656 RepID=A0AAE0TPC8_9PEZI|nr:Transcription initiation factor TFIID subunit 2 [Recurvomyces mirabilis]KAK5155758.1 Transcription initiation factor TFIID subunit 2 [Recurvomyces mirabilis]
MPGLVEEVVAAAMAAPPEYSVLKQRVDVDVDFATQTLRGSTEITLQPLLKDLKQIRLHCRQCKPTSIQAGGITAKYEYDDPYRNLRMPRGSTIHQHQMLREKLERSLHPQPEPELVIQLPPKLKIQELHIDPVTTIPQFTGTPSLQKQESDAMAIAAETPTIAAAAQQGPQFAPIKLSIEFETTTLRDGVRWLGCLEGDKHYPYMYTKAERWPGNTSCIFPCLDDRTSRCSWELSIRCPRTLGDAFRTSAADKAIDPGPASTNGDIVMTNGDQAQVSGEAPFDYLIDLGDEDAALELAVVCVDSEDETRRTVSFTLADPVAARHVGFAIGPFERIDLSSTRATEDEERLGQSAIRVDGYCLPRRGEEVRNTCFPMTRAMDYFAVNYGSFPFSAYQMLFVDDLIYDTVPAAGLSICSTRLLFPETIIEPMDRNTRVLIRALADQWMGVSVIAKEPTDAWAVAGVAGYMTDAYGKILFGNNAYRWQQKLAAERVYELDADRPSIYHHGPLLHLEQSVRDFLDLKSALVLFILDRRILKASGLTGVQRIVNRIFMNAKSGSLENGELSTAEFQRQCERLGHNKLESFFKQWVQGAGCPIFEVSQRFNKKKLVVEMTISQRQLDRQTKPLFAPNNFMREIKEYTSDVWAPEVQPVFTGPMTIRIHEADGTPYEHIVEIKEQVTKLEIPYNTKYKRLKRSRRQKDRAAASENNAGEGGEDALLYCLGDILDSPEQQADWQLMDWTTEDEERMGQESFEWIRMDADFEWIGKIHLTMPLYMYVSQLQQDRDLVAQYESMRYLIMANPHHVSLSILVRTLMDRRYFHGIRTMAADGIAILAANAKAETEMGGKVKALGGFHLQKAFEEMFCFPGESIPRPNDWTNRVQFTLQCALPRAMSKLRDVEGKVPMPIRQFFVDKLRFNDNSDNPFSDCHYITTLMHCLADSLVISHREPQPTYTFSFGGDDESNEPENPDEPFETEGIDAIERYRRIDEYNPTYHNIYSMTALECLQKLAKAGMVKDKTREVLQYTRSGNADLVRIAAFKSLTEIGLTRKMGMMKYLLRSIAEELAPYVRNKLMGVLGEALGHIALGDPTPEQPATVAATGEAEGLVLEQEASNETRAIEANRKASPEGAIAALKVTLGDEEVLKEALWYAATSTDISLDDIAGLCDIAALMFDPVASSIVTLRLPRQWHVARQDRSNKVMRFRQHGPYRIAPRKPLDLEDLQRMTELGLLYTGPKAVEAVKRRQSSEEDIPLAMRKQLQQSVMGPPPPAVIATPTPTPTTEKPMPIIKLKLGGDKRKASVDLGSQRAGSPKAPKLTHAQSPPARRSPSVASQRRNSTPGSSALARSVKRDPLKLRFCSAAQGKLQDILSRPPQPAGKRKLSVAPRADARQASRSITPTHLPAAAISPSFAAGPPSSLLHSPSGSFSFPSPSGIGTVQQPQLNLGGFRSYDLVPPAAQPVATVESAVPTAASPTPSSTLTTAASMSPPAENGMPPPPRPKLKLKLGGPRKSMDAGSASGAGGGASSPP